VEARSAGLGKGSEFVVRLPATLAAPTLVGDADAGTKAVARRLRILIVDDNVDSAESLATLLGMEGHETRTANDGLAAIEAAESLQPDVMLLDIGLPRLDGYDVCRRIRGLAWGKHVTIVAVTGWGHGDDREKSRAAGFDGHLVKPVRYDALTELLASIASPSSAESTS
jgi:CheY-like chemotaxis protein